MSLAELIKASFGGDRSAAGRYAAEQRWKGHQKKDKQPKGRASGSLDDEVAMPDSTSEGICLMTLTEFSELVSLLTNHD